MKVTLEYRRAILTGLATGSVMLGVGPEPRHSITECNFDMQGMPIDFGWIQQVIDEVYIRKENTRNAQLIIRKLLTEN